MDKDEEKAHNAVIKSLDELQESHKERMAPVGWYCHTWAEGAPHKGDIERQGKVVGQPQVGYFLIQWYSWLAGDTTYATLVPAAEMVGYSFYANLETWRHYGDTYQPKLKERARVPS